MMLVSASISSAETAGSGCWFHSISLYIHIDNQIYRSVHIYTHIQWMIQKELLTDRQLIYSGATCTTKTDKWTYLHANIYLFIYLQFMDEVNSSGLQLQQASTNVYCLATTFILLRQNSQSKNYLRVKKVINHKNRLHVLELNNYLCIHYLSSYWVQSTKGW